MSLPFVSELVVFVLFFVGGVTGSLSHEMTHWIVATVGGRDPVVDWRALEVSWDIDRFRPADRMAALAPQTLGVASISVWAIAGFPLPLGWPALGGWWLTYSLLGSREDFAVGFGTADLRAEAADSHRPE
jgi:hypothetical protein